MCHVLFKLPSAGTPIYTSPWGPIPLCLSSSIQPASHSSITHSSIPPSPSQSIHPWRTEDKIGEETIQGGQGGRKEGEDWQRGDWKRRKRGVKRHDCRGETVWPCVRLMYLWRKRIVDLHTQTRTHTQAQCCGDHHFVTVLAYPLSRLSLCLSLSMSGLLPASAGLNAADSGSGGNQTLVVLGTHAGTTNTSAVTQ